MSAHHYYQNNCVISFFDLDGTSYVEISGPDVITGNSFSVKILKKEFDLIEQGIPFQKAIKSIPKEEIEFLISGIIPDSFNDILKSDDFKNNLPKSQDKNTIVFSSYEEALVCIKKHPGSVLKGMGVGKYEVEIICAKNSDDEPSSEKEIIVLKNKLDKEILNNKSLKNEIKLLQDKIKFLRDNIKSATEEKDQTQNELVAQQRKYEDIIERLEAKISLVPDDNWEVFQEREKNRKHEEIKERARKKGIHTDVDPSIVAAALSQRGKGFSDS